MRPLEGTVLCSQCLLCQVPWGKGGRLLGLSGVRMAAGAAPGPKPGYWVSLNVFDKFSIAGAVSGVLLLGYGLNNDIVVNKKDGKSHTGAKAAAKSSGQFFLIVSGIAAVCVGTVKVVAHYWQIDKMVEVPSKANAALAPTSAVLSNVVKSAASSLNLKTTASLPPITKEDKVKWDEFVGELEQSWKTAADKRKEMEKESPKPDTPHDFVQLAHQKAKSVLQAIGLKKATPAALAHPPSVPPSVPSAGTPPASMKA